jgi:hypothetical protein
VDGVGRETELRGCCTHFLFAKEYKNVFCIELPMEQCKQMGRPILVP